MAINKNTYKLHKYITDYLWVEADIKDEFFFVYFSSFLFNSKFSSISVCFLIIRKMDTALLYISCFLI